MRRLSAHALIAAALLAAVGLASVSAQQTLRVRGTIEKVDGDKLTVKSDDGAALTLTLTANAQVVGVVKATLADIKSGDFVGSAAMPQADGSQKALEVHIFAESQRGTGEGHRPFTIPNSTMTNGTVGEMVTAADGQSLTVKYKDGEKKVMVTPETAVVTYVVGDKSDLKPGIKIFVGAGKKQADGTVQTPRVTYGKDGLTPPM